MLIAFHILIQTGLITRILLRQHRDPAARVAWIVVVLALPVVGIGAYLLLGETNIGARRAERLRRILATMPKMSEIPGWDAPMLRADVPEFYRPLFNVGRSISGFEPVGGNAARLMADSDATIDAMVADIEAACDHVHVLFYICNWLRVSLGYRICLKAAAELDFQPVFPDRVTSSFPEGWNGWKPPWASDSHAIGSRIV